MTLLIHPGFHKTATTWLQNELFTDPRWFRMLMQPEDVQKWIVRPHDFAFDADAARQEIAARRAAGTPASIDVISNENLVANPFFGSRESKLLVERLRLIAPEAKILLTVRRQPAAMRSLYQQYVKRGGSLSVEDFFDQNEKCEPGYYGFDPLCLRFDLLADEYARAFGPDNVLVLPQELLAKDARAFLGAILQHCGMAGPAEGETPSTKMGAGKSPPDGGVPLLRLANRLRPTPVYPAGPRSLAPIGNFLYRLAYHQHAFSSYYRRKLEGAIEERASGHYAAGNRHLQSYCPVDLAKLKYEMAEDVSLPGVAAGGQ
ncbi:sulfotransferase [Novosphingobium mangrovi (ex Huang et al. 2023)]|uniref:Sulfotransferase n=1 Tax=Novosphingobium mangrovi (ex Huang et al. 2023) TaxID=2976432 RepID=A0ABT2I0R2_9SPHN|nr:sulfotransferase [Novosphingobium mangrovi (ex Huang et al. 2023)]MCT2398389.1 sulfotransferase [Novosphingobium mangrovi (ex Huang et al. 2023)]